MSLLLAFSPPDPESILAPEVSEEDHIARLRLPAYWLARDSFLMLGAKVEKTENVQQLYKIYGLVIVDLHRLKLQKKKRYKDDRFLL